MSSERAIEFPCILCRKNALAGVNDGGSIKTEELIDHVRYDLDYTPYYCAYCVGAWPSRRMINMHHEFHHPDKAPTLSDDDLNDTLRHGIDRLTRLVFPQAFGEVGTTQTLVEYLQSDDAKEFAEEMNRWRRLVHAKRICRVRPPPAVVQHMRSEKAQSTLVAEDASNDETPSTSRTPVRPLVGFNNDETPSTSQLPVNSLSAFNAPSGFTSRYIAAEGRVKIEPVDPMEVLNGDAEETAGLSATVSQQFGGYHPINQSEADPGRGNVVIVRNEPSTENADSAGASSTQPQDRPIKHVYAKFAKPLSQANTKQASAKKKKSTKGEIVQKKKASESSSERIAPKRLNQRSASSTNRSGLSSAVVKKKLTSRSSLEKSLSLLRRRGQSPLSMKKRSTMAGSNDRLRQANMEGGRFAAALISLNQESTPSTSGGGSSSSSALIRKKSESKSLVKNLSVSRSRGQLPVLTDNGSSASSSAKHRGPFRGAARMDDGRYTAGSTVRKSMVSSILKNAISEQRKSLDGRKRRHCSVCKSKGESSTLYLKVSERKHVESHLQEIGKFRFECRLCPPDKNGTPWRTIYEDTTKIRHFPNTHRVPKPIEGTHFKDYSKDLDSEIAKDLVEARRVWHQRCFPAIEAASAAEAIANEPDDMDVDESALPDEPLEPLEAVEDEALEHLNTSSD